jgi:hypothetical protein
MHQHQISDKNKDDVDIAKLEDYFTEDACKKIKEYHDEFEKLRKKDVSIYHIALTGNFLLMVDNFINAINNAPSVLENIHPDILINIYQIIPFIEKIEAFVAMISPHKKKEF